METAEKLVRLKTLADAVSKLKGDYEAKIAAIKIPKAVSELSNDSGYQTASDVKAFADAAIDAFAKEVSDDGAVDTFKELVDYVASHAPEAASFASGIAELKRSVAELEGKVAALGTGGGSSGAPGSASGLVLAASRTGVALALAEDGHAEAATGIDAAGTDLIIASVGCAGDASFSFSAQSGEIGELPSPIRAGAFSDVIILAKDGYGKAAQHGHSVPLESEGNDGYAVGGTADVTVSLDASGSVTVKASAKAAAKAWHKRLIAGAASLVEGVDASVTACGLAADVYAFKTEGGA